MQYRYMMLDRERARELYHAGCSDTEIGRQLGVTQQSVYGWRKKLGLPPHRRTQRKPLQNAIRPLVEAGLSNIEIASRIGRDLHTVTVAVWAIRNPSAVRKHKIAYRARLQADVTAARRELKARA
mgnify:CR=1 FL=1